MKEQEYQTDIEQATEHFTSGEWDYAEKLYRKALIIKPEDKFCLAQLRNITFERKRIEDKNIADEQRRLEEKKIEAERKRLEEKRLEDERKSTLKSRKEKKDKKPVEPHGTGAPKEGILSTKVVIALAVFSFIVIIAIGYSFLSKGAKENPQIAEPASPAQQLPGKPEAIKGLTTVVPGQRSVTYTVPVIANATAYLWSLPAGSTGSGNTNSIIVNFYANAVSGDISVRGKNSAGEGPSSSLAICVRQAGKEQPNTPPPTPTGVLPGKPEAINGAATVTQGQASVSYTVPSISDATKYIWSLPSGATGSSNTNTISVNFGSGATSGNISVKGNNSVGDGPASTLSVKVNIGSIAPSDKLDFPNGYYEGTILNGKMDGRGRFTFTKDGIISKDDPMENKATAGDYLIGTWKNGELKTGKLFDKNGKQKAIISL